MLYVNQLTHHRENLNTKRLFDLSERVIILTGASGLLGSKYAEGLSQYGANIVLADINYIQCKKLEKKLHDIYGTEPLAVKTNISNPKSVKKMVSEAIKKFRKIDVLVNNAVFPETRQERTIPFEKFPISVWNNIISVNLTGVLLCTQQVGQVMLKQKKGSIINVSSIYGMVAADQRIYGKSRLNSTVAYAITKSAILNLTRYVASYWNRTGIRVNTLTLGGAESGQDPEFIKNYSYRTMIGRMARTDEYIGALLFLASDASSYMTGSNLVVDGGWTAW